MTNNPLLQPSELKHQALPFSQIKSEHFLPALNQAIDWAKKRIEKIKQHPQANFENCIEALEEVAAEADLVSSVFYNFLSAHTNSELQNLANEMGPRLSQFSNDMLLDEKLFAQIKSVYDQNFEQLNQEQTQLLKNTYRNFIRNGAQLNETKKQELRQIDERMSQLGPAYSENLLKATNEFELLIDNEDDLRGLPDSICKQAQATAEAKSYKNKWLFTLHAPSLIPFMKYSAQRTLREKLWHASSQRAFKGTYDNQKNILELVQLRYKRAQLLGFKNHAEYVLKERMAKSPQKVMEFLDKIYAVAFPSAQKEVAEILQLAQQTDGLKQLMPWDFAYYAEKLKQQKYEYDEEELKAYFPIHSVLHGIFKVANKLYQIDFKETTEYPVYHKDVQVYEVIDSSTNKFIGLLYFDLYTRESKSSGAWMTNYREQGHYKGQLIRPHVSINCNFSKPLPDQPTLLTFNEVRTVFHEFGHALHSLLTQCHYRSLSGTNVYWDFVELPSQIMENWVLENECLDLFAKHYKTGETISKEFTEKIKKSSQFLAGYFNIRQLNFSFLDMGWHFTDPTNITDVVAHEKKSTEKTQLLPVIDNTCMSCSFSHIFDGGYSSGYYSYKWAEVLDADAFELFLQKGVFDSKTANSFRKNILERGGTEHPMKLYKKFRGREPDPQALLRRDGLIQ